MKRDALFECHTELKLLPNRVEASLLTRWYFWIPLPFFFTCFLTLIWGILRCAYYPDKEEFTADDFNDAPALSEKLLRATNGISFLLQKKLSSKTRELLTDLRPWNSTGPEIRQGLAKDFERIIHTNLFDASRIETSQLFTNVNFRQRTRELLRNPSITNSMARLNRMLLEDAYPDEIFPKLSFTENVSYCTIDSFLRSWRLYAGGVASLLAAFAFVQVQNRFTLLLQTLVRSGTLLSLDPSHSVSDQISLYLEDFQAALRSKMGWLFRMGMLVLAIAFALMQLPPSEVQLVFRPPDGFLSYNWINAADEFNINYVMTLFFGYAFGAGAWALLVTSRFVRLLVERFQIVVKPGHPDQCGGLLPVGNFCLLMAVPTLIGIALVAFYGVVAFGRGGSSERHIAFLVCDAVVLFGILIPLASTMFFRTLWRFHQAMKEQQRQHHEEFAELETSCRAHLAKAVMGGDAAKIKEGADVLKSVQDLESRWVGFSAWPFRRATLAKFLSPQIASVVGFLFPIMRKYLKM